MVASSKMSTPPLPKRLIAYGHEPNGERVNTYQKMSVIALIKSTLEEDELQTLSESQFGKILMMQSMPALSGTFALHLIFRQLVIVNENELWFLFGGYPIRFSLREFKIVTGLNCGKFPIHLKKKNRVSGKSKKAFYKEVFGIDGDILVSKVIGMLKKKEVQDPKMRLRYACLAFVDAILAPTTHYKKLKINREHVEMTRDLDEFLNYPWGRKSFQMITSSLKERDITQFATANVAIQGFFYAVQMVVFEAVPAIPENFISHGGLASDPEDDFVSHAPQRITLRVNQLRDLDCFCEADVIPIIRPQLQIGDVEEDLSWTDDEEDPLVDNLLKLIEEDYPFDNSMFTGGEIPDQSAAPVNPPVRTIRQQNHVRKGKGIRRRSQAGKGDNRTPIGPSSSLNTITVEDIVNGLLPHLPGIVAKELVENNSAILAGITDWFKTNFELSGPSIDVRTEPPTNRPASQFSGDGGNVDGQRHGSGNSTGDNDNASNHDDFDDITDKNGNEDVNGHEEDSQSDVSSSAEDSHISPTASETINNVISHYPEEVETALEITSKLTEKGQTTEGDICRDGLKVPADQDLQHTTCPSPTAADLSPQVDAGETIIEPKLSDMNSLESEIPEQVLSKHNDYIQGAGHSLYSLGLTQQLQVIPTDVEMDNVNCMEAGRGPANDEREEMHRKSKRQRTVSSRLDGDLFQVDKRMKVAIGQQTSAQAEIEREREWRLRRALTSTASTYHLGGSVTLSFRDVADLLERKKNTTAKVMDALCKFTRHMFRSGDGQTGVQRVDILDSKFVSSFSRLFPKFSKTQDPSDFQFSKSIVDAFKGTGDDERIELAQCDRLYMPFNFDKTHWVVLCVDLTASKISVLDPYMANRTDAALKGDLRPIAVMLPYLIRQLFAAVGDLKEMSQAETNEFQLVRISSIPQVTSIWDSGLMSIFLMEAHATGGNEHCSELGTRSLEVECKKLVIGLYETYVLS